MYLHCCINDRKMESAVPDGISKCVAQKAKRPVVPGVLPTIALSRRNLERLSFDALHLGDAVDRVRHCRVAGIAEIQRHRSDDG